MPSAPSTIRYDFRVLVLELRKPGKDLPFVASCLELNRVGRGRTPIAAMKELRETVREDLLEHLNEGLPLHPDPDPDLVAVFKTRPATTQDGDRVHGTYTLHCTFTSIDSSGPKRPSRARVTDERLVATHA